MDTAIEFICSLYDKKKQNKRHQWFKVQIKCAREIGELEAAANQKQSMISHVYRANNQGYIWKNANRLFLSLPYPVENDWIKPDGGKLEPALMTKLPPPENLIELTVCRCRKKCINNTCHCGKDGFSHVAAEKSVWINIKSTVTSILMSLTN